MNRWRASVPSASLCGWPLVSSDSSVSFTAAAVSTENHIRPSVVCMRRVPPPANLFSAAPSEAISADPAAAAAESRASSSITARPHVMTPTSIPPYAPPRCAPMA